MSREFPVERTNLVNCRDPWNKSSKYYSMKISLFLFFIHEQTLTTFDLKYPKKTILVQRIRSPPRSEMGCFPNWSREGRKPIRCSLAGNRFDFPDDPTD